MKAKTTVLLWCISLALMPIMASINLWLIIIPFFSFLRVSLYMEKHSKRFINELKLID